MKKTILITLFSLAAIACGGDSKCDEARAACEACAIDESERLVCDNIYNNPATNDDVCEVALAGFVDQNCGS